MANTLELQSILNDVNAQKMVLPDFQRKFIWDIDDMYGLYASVLCKMPIGSILTLESNDKAFSCKKIGAKPRSCLITLPDGKSVEFLLDGQQRLTSLFAGFTTYYFENFKNDDFSNIAAQRLHHLFFIKVPDENNTKDKDIFSVRNLSFDSNWDNTGVSYFSSEEMKKLITSEHISKILPEEKDYNYDLTKKENLNEIKKYCCTSVDGFYRIPLQFSLFTQGPIATKLKRILETIAIAHSDDSDDSEDQRDEWVTNVTRYLSNCLTKLELNKIIVKNSDKARAIDIYSNLNKGGIALNVFDLIMAKVGTISDKNFYDELVTNIQKPLDFPNTVIKDSLRQYAKDEKYTNPTDVAKVLSAKDEITKDYINVFLNVMAMYITQKNRPEDQEFNENCTKQAVILELDPKKIKDNAELVCKAISRALLFFQNRCGIRTISDINYKAQLAVVAYFFTDDKLFRDEKVHLFFEYWYWITIFAYLYPSNQNIEIYKEIPKFEKYFENRKKNIYVLDDLKKFQIDVLNKSDYSDLNTLILDPSRRKDPPAIMTKYVCQYYMAISYFDFWDKKTTIGFLNTDDLDIHHIMPLGSDPVFKQKKISIGETTKTLRNKKDNPYNSPLNMLYITKTSNKKISDMDYQTYSQTKEVLDVITELGCLTTFDDNTTIQTFLTERYKKLKGAVNNRLDSLYNCMAK